MEQIIQKFIELREKFHLQVTDEALFSEAVKLYISIGIQKGYGNVKEKTETAPQATKTQNRGIPNPASEPQRKLLTKVWNTQDGQEYLKEIGFNGDFGLLDKKSAFELISKVKKKQEESY